MKAKAEAGEARIEDLYRVEGQAEIINGKIVRMPFHGCYLSYAIGRAKSSLHEYSKVGKKGTPLGSTVAFIVDLPHRKAFCPDLAFHTGPVTMGFPKGAPVFVAEFRDPESYGAVAERKIKDKIVDYFEAGTQVVWDVDMLRDKVVRVYRASDPDKPTVYRPGEIAEAEPAVPGWKMPVDDLFYPADENTNAQEGK
jgi:Uma2 family endonuclease